MLLPNNSEGTLKGCSQLLFASSTVNNNAEESFPPKMTAQTTINQLTAS